MQLQILQDINTVDHDLRVRHLYPV